MIPFKFNEAEEKSMAERVRAFPEVPPSVHNPEWQTATGTRGEGGERHAGRRRKKLLFPSCVTLQIRSHVALYMF